MKSLMIELTPPMKPEIKTLWIGALRDKDRFKQGDGTLKRIDEENNIIRHCCLGVLCDLAIEAGVPIVVETFSTSDFSQDTHFDGESDFLPGSVREWAGLENVNPRVLNPGDEDVKITDVATLNDGGYTFAEIADVIEKSL